MIVVAGRTAVSALAGVVFVVLSCSAGLGSLLVAAMSCDDTCAGDRPPPGADWTDYSDAAQWSELAGLAGANMLLAVLAAGLMIIGRRRVALLPVVLHGVASVLLVGLLDQSGDSAVGWAWILATTTGLVMALAARER